MLAKFFLITLLKLGNNSGHAKHVPLKNKCTTLNNKQTVTQEKIIERIKNAAVTLTFGERRWRDVSDSAKKLLRGLLNVDAKKRMKLKDLNRHEWIKTQGGSNLVISGTRLKLATPKVLNKHFGIKSGEFMSESAVTSNANGSASSSSSSATATLNAVVSAESDGLNESNKTVKNELDESHASKIMPVISKSTKYGKNLELRNQFNLAFDAFHAAEEKGWPHFFYEQWSFI